MSIKLVRTLTRTFVLMILFVIGCKGNLFASHIVGGEFELVYVEGDRYRLNLILYFDEINGNPQALDNTIVVYIYRKSDNARIRQVVLPLQENDPVPYSNVDCNEDFLQTSRLVYTNELFMEPDEFGDPEGYYVSFERCCRNYTIDNIFSAEPGTALSAGQTFYLEFPPVVKDGKKFINSTPSLFPPLRDYGCVDKFYYADFSGVDNDGDSLVYSMVVPYTTFEITQPLPSVPNPGPYPQVRWRPGFGIRNIMGGDPDLSISPDGLLTVVPKLTGLFVFAVKCEEFRDGIKIGEMRRDFQMLVVDGCLNNPPRIQARVEGSTDVYEEGTLIEFDYTDEDKCVEFEVRDIPVSGEEVENVMIRAIPINFDADLEDIQIDVSQNVPLRDADDVANFTVCFPDCPYVPFQPYEIGIIAMDDACPQPDLDTVIVRLEVKPPPNTRPFFEDLPSVVNIEVTEEAGGRYEQVIVSRDSDLDNLILDTFPFGFNLEEYGMSIQEVENSAGLIETRFVWDYDCQTVSFDDQTEFTIQMRLDDEDACLIADPVNLTINLKINLPPNTEPEIYTNRSEIDEEEVVFRYNLGDEVRFDVLGIDNDNDQVTITGAGLNFDFDEFGVSFNGVTARGLDDPTAPFSLIFPCDYVVEERDTLNMAFYIEDFDKCEITNLDTVNVSLVVDPPTNTLPQISARSLTNVSLVNDMLNANIGEEIRIRIQGIDFDDDSIYLELVEADPRLSGRFTFENVGGFTQVQSDLIWLPECEGFPEGALEEVYQFTFQVSDNNCYSTGDNLITLEFTIEDFISTDESFIPPNIFTPNGDRYNPYFALDGVRDDDVPINTGLPLDNCENKFEEVIVYNRWGKVVYRSNDRFFKWYGTNVASGVYYYLVRFTDEEYKGQVTVRY